MSWNKVLLAAVACVAVGFASSAQAQVSVGVGGVSVGVGTGYYAPPAVSVYRAPVTYGYQYPAVAPVTAYSPAYGPAPVAYGPAVGVTVARPVVVAPRPLVVRPRYRFGQPVRNVVRRVIW